MCFSIFVDRCLSFVLFLLAIVLSILLQYTDSDYPFDYLQTLLHTRCLVGSVLLIYHRSCYKTYTSRRNCGFYKVESAGSDHKPDTSQVPLLNEQTDDTSTDIALCIFCGKHTFKKDRKLHKIKTAERLQNVKDATGQNVVACHSRR